MQPVSRKVLQSTNNDVYRCNYNCAHPAGSGKHGAEIHLTLRKQHLITWGYHTICQWNIQKETDKEQEKKKQQKTTQNHRIVKTGKDLQSFRTQYVYLLELLISIFLYISIEASSLFMHQNLKHQLSKVMHNAPSYHFQYAGMLIISLQQETAHNHWSPNFLLWFEEWEREGNFSFNCSDDSEQKAYWVMV